jgi:hypothetical protein
MVRTGLVARHNTVRTGLLSPVDAIEIDSYMRRCDFRVVSKEYNTGSNAADSTVTMVLPFRATHLLN